MNWRFQIFRLTGTFLAAAANRKVTNRFLEIFNKISADKLCVIWNSNFVKNFAEFIVGIENDSIWIENL